MKLFESGLRSHLPLLRILTVLIGLHILLAWGLTAMSRSFNSAGLPPVSWSWAPAVSAQTSEPPADGWLPIRTSLAIRRIPPFIGFVFPSIRSIPATLVYLF